MYDASQAYSSSYVERVNLKNKLSEHGILKKQCRLKVLSKKEIPPKNIKIKCLIFAAKSQSNESIYPK